MALFAVGLLTSFLISVWAQHAAERRGATGFDVPVLSRSILQENVLETEDYVVAIDILRVKAQRLKGAIERLEELPGAKILRGGTRNMSLPEVRSNLDDIERFTFEPLLGLIRSEGVTRNARALALYANNQFFQLRIERDGTAARIQALREALREYTSPRAASAAIPDGGRAPSEQPASPFGESFLDRLVEMSTQAQTSDVAYRQRLTDDVIAQGQRLTFLDKEVAYYEELGRAVRGMNGRSSGSPETVAFIKTRSRAAFDALGAATDDVMAIVPGPFVVQEQPPLSVRTVMLYFVLAMLAAPRRLDSGNLDRMSQVFSSRRLAPA